VLREGSFVPQMLKGAEADARRFWKEWIGDGSFEYGGGLRKAKTPRWRASAGEDGFVWEHTDRLGEPKTLRPEDGKGERGGSKP